MLVSWSFFIFVSTNFKICENDMLYVFFFFVYVKIQKDIIYVQRWLSLWAMCALNTLYYNNKWFAWYKYLLQFQCATAAATLILYFAHWLFSFIILFFIINLNHHTQHQFNPPPYKKNIILYCFFIFIFYPWRCYQNIYIFKS